MWSSAGAARWWRSSPRAPGDLGARPGVGPASSPRPAHGEVGAGVDTGEDGGSDPLGRLLQVLDDLAAGRGSPLRVEGVTRSDRTDLLRWCAT